MTTRRKLGAALALVVVAGVTVLASRSDGAGPPTDADRRYVAVLARHVRHEGELASVAVGRLTAADGGVLAVAQQVAAEAPRRAAALEAMLARWGVDGNQEVALFAGAVGVGTIAPGTVVYGCSLVGPVDDTSQLQAATPDRVASRYAQLAMASSVEARTLVATGRDRVGGVAARAAAELDAWQRGLLRAVAPWVPATDQAYASRGGDPLAP